MTTTGNSPYAKKTSKKFFLTEKVIKYFFALNGITAIVFILLIFLFLLKEGINAFDHLGVSTFIFDRDPTSGNIIFEWYPTSDESRFSLVPLLLGSFLVAFPATLLSTIFGISVGIYLSEIANPKVREVLKPAVELFAGIPTVVIGFFMLVIGATFFQDVFQNISRLNAFLASLGLSLIVVPIIASLTEDALRAIPNEIRMSSYALGATRWQTIIRVLLPTAVSGISASVILGFGRAIGETMIVLMASGNAAELTLNIFSSVRTMTATIAAEMGEVSQDSNHYYALFVIGLALFVATFLLNLIAEIIINKMRKRVKL